MRKLSDLGITGLEQWVVAAPSGRRRALAFGQALAVVRGRYGPRGVERFRRLLWNRR
jgi:hypothetical protein